MAKTILTLFQKDVLSLFAKNKALSKHFYLTGGTALAEFHLHHRLSEDLDFFSETEFSIIPIQTFLKQLSKELKLSKVEYRSFMGIHTFFLYKDDEILKIDFNYYPFPRIEKGENFEGLSIDSLHDIAVNKLQTIATKPRSRDFIDLYFIIKKTGWNIATLRKEARAKFDWYVDSLKLGAQFLLVDEVKDFPRLIDPLEEKEWQDFFKEEAKKLEQDIIEK